jgi:hypothetical protein
MPVSAEYVREHPEKEYVLDMPGHTWHGEVGDVEFSVTGKIIGIAYSGITGTNYFTPCTEDNITVKGNLQHYGPNGEGAADDGELFYVGFTLDGALSNNKVFIDIEDAREEASWYDYKIYKVQVAIFFDTAEEVK